MEEKRGGKFHLKWPWNWLLYAVTCIIKEVTHYNTLIGGISMETLFDVLTQYAEENLVSRLLRETAPQLRVAQLRADSMIDCWNLRFVAKQNKKLAKYMYNYLAMMMTISSIFLTMGFQPNTRPTGNTLR